jgi:mevalonate kinase
VTYACAPGKIILFGEHAVVYGRPAIAVPVQDVQACVAVSDERDKPGVTICADDIGCVIDVASAPPDEPLSLTVRDTLACLGLDLDVISLVLTIRSSIPVASGMGSGAAVSAAIARALCAHFGCPLEPEIVSSVVYRTEQIHHGTPSGIDNTVVVYEQPVCFCRGEPIVTLAVREPFWLVIADTGVSSLTKAAVADVRAAWQKDPQRYDRIFDQIGSLVQDARRAIEGGSVDALGPLMDRNHDLLRALGVSSPELETLIAAARQAGACGAKLSGGGRGGNAIAVIDGRDGAWVKGALLDAGAKRVIVTKVSEGQ